MRILPAALFALTLTTGVSLALPHAATAKLHKAERGQQAQMGDRGRVIAYGTAPLQTLTFHRVPGTAPAPLILFVHGGGWSKGDMDNATGRHKAAHYTGQGYAFASMNYRLVPDVRVEDQAGDIAAALAYARKNAAELGVDPNRIVLMGHSAGAHLVALVGTDPSYLRAHGLALSALAGVIALDGAAYDVPTQMAEGPRAMQDTYQAAFGVDPVRQAALSPTRHAAAPNAPAFLIPYVQRKDGIAQSKALAKALEASGTPAELASVKGKGLPGHMQINRRLGDPDYPATAIVDAWLAKRFQ